MESCIEGRRIEVRGTVQGVGFRPWVYRLARATGISGRVRNDARGVTIEAFGSAEALEGFVARLTEAPPPAASIRELETAVIAPERAADFVIVESLSQGERRVSAPPDLATCPDCRREILDPRDRRHRYPFTNCTSCGPRFTILRGVPYDRATTSMAGFEMCAACRREYESPLDRRFHAEPNACPACGPRLVAVSPGGQVQNNADPLRLAAEALRGGLVVAIKGVGGFHLACDASSSAAVTRLRRRKRRDHKPFAVMARDLSDAGRLAHLTQDERVLLTSVERPIVLARARAGSGLAPEVAPRNPLVGLMLPYSPLHHLLLAEADTPLVMTSGNLSDEPIAKDNDEALERLGSVADLFLLHDRDIETRCDDSVARIVAGRPVVLRRGRGYVPRPVAVSPPFERPVLACGGQIKNAACIGVSDTAYLGPHVGDLDSLGNVQAFEDAVRHLERLLEVRPEIVAYDLHPGYRSTVYALTREEPLKVGVQHHHAHVASVMAEHGLAGPVIGVAYDGTGYGTDGALWGGEILVAGLTGFERRATLRPLPLPGGEAAIRDVWRLALVLLDDAFEGAPPSLDAFPLFRHVPEAAVESVRRIARVPTLAPRAHGVGRYFDALGALVLGLSLSHHEGEVALEWNLVADPGERGAYPYDIDESASPWMIDLRPLVRAVVDDLRAGAGPARISSRFHNALALATADAVRRTALGAGGLPVALSGGCFQNALLAERVLDALAPRFPVYLHRAVPPGDGGLALGQAVVARAVVEEGREGPSCA
ncbi:MAG TPA: carbamoyltransferase HypF [Vicinamibacteria bacterium]|nr:carbamoyltransferase HypF [Vicinamibacteria bacterium]